MAKNRNGKVYKYEFLRKREYEMKEWKRRVRKIIDITMIKFLMVGMINTLFGTCVMFAAYNLFHLNYWISSALNYILGSILSFTLNKNFTFQNKSKDVKIVAKFIINISLCYIVAYGIAKPLVRVLLSDVGKSMQDNGAMLAGMCLFMILNYFGQRFFAFKE